jgi:hypothetical protein
MRVRRATSDDAEAFAALMASVCESYGFEREGVRRDHCRRRDGTLRSSLMMSLLLEAQSRPSGGT